MRAHLRARDLQKQAAVALNVLVLAVGMPLGLNLIISGKQAAALANPHARGPGGPYSLNPQEEAEVSRLLAERRAASPLLTTAAAVGPADLSVFDSVLSRAGK